ncbi:MAG: type II/IV secretion system ATPase subunit [Nanobdellota archaeon]
MPEELEQDTPKETGEIKEKDVADEWLDSYKLNVNNTLIDVNIFFRAVDPVPIYEVNITNMTKTTKVILEKIREEFISQVGIGAIEISEGGGIEQLKKEFRKEIMMLLAKYFPNADEKTHEMLMNYVIEQNLGLGYLEILLKDNMVEEIVVNNAREPVWIYQRNHGWMKTNIIIPTEGRIRHFSTMIARDVSKEITNLNPLLDAHLLTGDRVNATFSPISTKGNTLTIRKFSSVPWNMTRMINNNTIDNYTAALLWLCIEFELSIIISGGTGSGKTSMLNSVSGFIPANQRIISIEDTRELQLPPQLHWVPLATRSSNPEGKGGVDMLDLVVNSLRMRPDRIIMGEIRRKEEAEVLFEAMHTGHSVYGTFHANSAEEVISRLSNPPIALPKNLLGALNVILVQNRNRRDNTRRMFEFAEVDSEGNTNIVYRFDIVNNEVKKVGDFKVINKLLELYAGIPVDKFEEEINKRKKIIDWLVKNNIQSLNRLGLIFSKFYRGRLEIDE